MFCFVSFRITLPINESISWIWFGSTFWKWGDNFPIPVLKILVQSLFEVKGPRFRVVAMIAGNKSRFNFNFLVYSLGGPAGGGGEVCSSTIRIRSIHQVGPNTTTTTAPATDLTTFQWDERQGEANKQTVCWSNASAVETFGCKGALNKHCNPSQVANTPKSCLNGKTSENNQKQQSNQDKVN